MFEPEVWPGVFVVGDPFPTFSEPMALPLLSVWPWADAARVDANSDAATIAAYRMWYRMYQLRFCVMRAPIDTAKTCSHLIEEQRKVYSAR